MKLLQDKVVLVMGGLCGIGVSIVSCFVEVGVQVVFIYCFFKEKVEVLVSELVVVYGVMVKVYQLDVVFFLVVEELVKVVVEDFGGFDVLVNNVGIMCDNLILCMSEEYWD